jgi:ribosomal protein S27E
MARELKEVIIESCVCGEVLCRIKHGKYREFTNNKIIQDLFEGNQLLTAFGELKVTCPKCGQTTLFDMDIATRVKGV